METIVWIAQGLLATAFLAAGSMKLMKSHAQLLEMGDNMKWVEDFDPWHIKSIATAEVLGAIGLILPRGAGHRARAHADRRPRLGVDHARRRSHPRSTRRAASPTGQRRPARLATFVAIERFGPHAL